ncbi:MAG: hypothetical protein PHC62_00865 [Candidatus Izemoplasmatales bacterium]|nr:hypothetical protein [Candidatus Izemoplasmatales bacterium]
MKQMSAIVTCLDPIIGLYLYYCRDDRKGIIGNININQAYFGLSYDDEEHLFSDKLADDIHMIPEQTELSVYDIFEFGYLEGNKMYSQISN